MAGAELEKGWRNDSGDFLCILESFASICISSHKVRTCNEIANFSSCNPGGGVLVEVVLEPRREGRTTLF